MHMGSLVWDNPPKKTNSNFSIIPYVTADVAQDYEDGADGSPASSVVGRWFEMA